MSEQAAATHPAAILVTKRLRDGEGVRGERNMGEGRRGSTLPAAPAPKLSLSPSCFFITAALPNKTMYLNFPDLS